MGEQFVQEGDLEDVFTALADETRLGILQALWEFEGQSATFSELREAVGMRDSGRFNYHLDTLVGTFVTRTEDGYRLTQAGKHANGAIASGRYTGRDAIRPIELDSSCRSCGGDQALSYEAEVARVECDSCHVGWSVPVPPAVLAGYGREEIPRVVSRYFRTRFRQVIDGFCLYCDGRTTPTVGPIRALEVGPESPEDASEGGDTRPSDRLAVQFDCQRCGATAGIGLDHALLLAHPTVAQFYHEHGIDVRDHLIWDSELDLGEQEVESHDPVSGRVTFRTGDAELVVTVDGSFTVTSTRRRVLADDES